MVFGLRRQQHHTITTEHINPAAPVDLICYHNNSPTSLLITSPQKHNAQLSLTFFTLYLHQQIIHHVKSHFETIYGLYGFFH